VKTLQSLTRHVNSNITTKIYLHARTLVTSGTVMPVPFISRSSKAGGHS